MTKPTIVGDDQAISPEAESSRPLPSASGDLVERLRAMAGMPFYETPERIGTFAREAADTITSLRAQLAAAEAKAEHGWIVVNQRNHQLDMIEAHLKVDPNDIWEAYVEESSAEYRSPQGAVAFTIDRLSRALTDGAKPCR